MTFKNLIRTIHLWLGLLSGLVVFIVSFTGCIYVFYEEIGDWVYQDRRTVDIPENPVKLSIDELIAIAVTEIPSGIQLSRIAMPTEEGRTYYFIFDKINKHAWSYSKYKEFYQTVFVNPYSGEIVKVENTKWEFFNVVLWLHMTLLTGHSLGGSIIKWAVYIFIVLLISGVILWWPRKRKKKKQYFWFQWKKKTNGKRKNYDLHRIPGFYVCFLALVFALTGLFWASENINNFSRWIANGGKVVTRTPWPTSDTTACRIQRPMETMYQNTKNLAPETTFILIKSPFNKSSPTLVRAYMGNLNYQRHEYLFDQYTGKVLGAVDFQSRNNGEKLAVLNYDIHVGSIGGLPTKILAFFGSLMVTTLPVTGFFIWWNKKRKSSVKKERSAIQVNNTPGSMHDKSAYRSRKRKPRVV